ncbi:uncharacterized protein yc1106_05499 [Curvularia clavata]|uniref:Uncharacterized protein n=1 Tax=Curvularia clavata TaxID=95742 RepID=A0A9Q8Z9N6_CURCL|nr:uncharacterized protein yc1106_05499 [Curvularia clavata]
MPLLVARRWPVVTRFHAALASRRPAQRFYAAPPPSTSGLREGARRKPITGGIIIPDSVQTQPHHLFESIKPLSPSHAPKRNFAVFFVTPSYAHFLLDDDAFLRTALRRIYKEAIETPGLTISALCAVVDKLPAPQPWNDRTLESQLSLRKQSPPVAGTGFEGIAYVSLPSRASVPSNESPLSPEHGAIDFITSDYVSKDEVCLDTLRLPLANTVFQTGMPTTMFHSSWKTNGKTGELTQVTKTTPSHHAVRLAESSNASDLESALSIPLLPLTLPRVVEGCMGNIIRRVVDANGKSIQASSELENVVPRFFSSRNQPAQATVAWALVIPKNLKHTISARTEELLASLPTGDGSNSVDHAWERLWRSDPPVWNTLVSHALSEGARLHRVLSGGGGWGKKAGLLSLDPVPAKESSGLPTGPESLATVDDPGNFESNLTPVVQDGDSIQFFTLPKSELAQEARESDNYQTVSKLTDANDSEGWELGTIPSTMDSIPGESWQHMGGEKHHSAFFQGSFGALTEGALTITRRRRRDVDKTSSVYTTMLDVPFSRFWAINPAQSPESIANHKDVDRVGKDKDSRSVRIDSDSSTTDVERPKSTSQQPESGKLQGKPRDFSTEIEGLQKSAPKLTLPDLIRVLGVTGVPKSGRLRARTARIIMYEIRRRFNEQLFEYRAITSGRHRQSSRRANLQSVQVKPELGSTNQGESSTRRIPRQEKGSSRKKQKDTSDDSDDAKRRKDSAHDHRQNKRVSSPKKKRTQAPPIRKLSINPKPKPKALRTTLHMLSFKVSRLADEAGAIIAAIRSRQPRTAQQSRARLPTRTRRSLEGQRISQSRLSVLKKNTPHRAGTHLRQHPKKQYPPRVRRVQARLRPRSQRGGERHVEKSTSGGGTAEEGGEEVAEEEAEGGEEVSRDGGVVAWWWDDWEWK